MRLLRQWHQYLSVFFAPAILFFAFSGLLQTTGFHESRDGSNYVPPAWIVTIASLHKDQRLPREEAEHHGPGPGDEGPGKDHDHDHHDGPRPGIEAAWPLKFFVLCLSLGLMSTAALGIAIALKSRATRNLSLIMLAAGTLLPIALILI